MTHLPFFSSTLRAAAAIANANFGKVSSISTKTGDNNQVLTETDLAIGAFIVDQIQKAYPDHNIIDEESPLIIEVFIENDCLTVRNNLQRKSFVETSNRKGLANLKSFYRYLSDREIETVEDGAFFTIKIPLI